MKEKGVKNKYADSRSSPFSQNCFGSPLPRSPKIQTGTKLPTMDRKQFQGIHEGEYFAVKLILYAEFEQVFTTALEGFVPIDITKTLIAFLDFCYVAR